MVNVFVEPLQIKIEMCSDENIHVALERAGVKIERPCGGNGVCGGCRIWAKEPDKILPTPHENITYQEEANGLRLACMASAPDVDTSILLEENYEYEMDENERTQGRILSVGIIKSPNQNSLVKINNHNVVSNPKGIAIDIGTTTLVVALVSLTTGKVLASATSLNPQIFHGHDVLSRIQYASTPDGLAQMSSSVREKIDELIEEVSLKSGTTRDEIVDVTIGANTTMLQIAAAIDPTPLGYLPFKVDIAGGTTFLPEKFALKVNKEAKVYLPPVLHAFVGSDISAGLLRSPEFFDHKKSVLYIDMGTNGEICLNVKGRYFTTSTAAGPAFEGMGISSGMRATDGAVERVDIKDGKLIFYVIGDGDIKGVCGSGIVDFIAALLTTEQLDRSGKLKLTENIKTTGNQHSYFINKVVQINSQPAFCYGEDIYLTQKDIRQIQLAKSAIRTGVDLILERGSITSESLDRIYIAGGFGNFLNTSSMERIGLFPENSAKKVIFCGNACIDGSIMLLTDKSARTFLESTLHNMEHIQLADSPEFMSCFIKNLNYS